MNPTDPTPVYASAARLADTSKSVFRSKTFYLQLLTFLSAFVPAIGKFIQSNPVEFVAVLSAVNVLIRFATSDRVHLFPPGDDGADDSTPPRSGMLTVLVLLACMATALLAVSLSSCSALQPGSPITTTAYYEAKDGTRVGITLTGTPKVPQAVEITPPAAVKPQTAPLLASTTTTAAPQLPEASGK